LAQKFLTFTKPKKNFSSLSSEMAREANGHELLVCDIRSKPESKARDKLLENALRFRYHDFKCKDADVVNEKRTLAKEAKEAGFEDIAEKALKSVYEDQPTQADADEFERETGIKLTKRGEGNRDVKLIDIEHLDMSQLFDKFKQMQKKNEKPHIEEA
jgi:hypothetical protein